MAIFNCAGSGGSGGGIWGSITGTLSNQTDLQSALDAQANMVTDEWSSSSVPYAKGSVVIYNNKLWKCLVANSVAPTEGSEWTETSVNELMGKFGKVLWTGSFSSGSITVDGLTNYNVIQVVASTGASAIGVPHNGCGGYATYGGYTVTLCGYRFAGTGDTLTITDVDKGFVSNGGSDAVVKIIGVV